MSESDFDSSKEKGTFQILSLSGGGARGLYSIQVLAQLEEYLADSSHDQNYNIAKHFDLICGTSIGGIVALALAHGKYNARDIFKIFDENRLLIFPRNDFFSRVPIIYNLYRLLSQICLGLYSQNALKKLLNEIFDDAVIGDLKTRALVPAVNFSKGATQLFKTPHNPDFRNDWKLSIVDVALSTSAAPTYFPIHEFNDSWYVDGGLSANSPSLMSVHEALNFIDEAKDKNIKLLSIGTMGQQKTANQNGSKRKGYIAWSAGRSLLDLTLSSNETLHNKISEHIIGKDNVLFIDDAQTPEQANSLSLDNASNSAAAILKSRGKERAKTESNNDKYKAMMSHIATQATFYYGANKNNVS